LIAVSLDEGVERLAVYNEKIAEIMLQKEELTNAQLLFGLEVRLLVLQNRAPPYPSVGTDFVPNWLQFPSNPT
jgi:hypothetical protein